MPLTVLNVAYPFAAVGRDAVGGAEQVLTILDDALVRAGHRSIVIGCEGSTCRGTLVPVSVGAFSGSLEDGIRSRVHARYREIIPRIAGRYRADVVHLHGIDFHAYLPPPGLPVLVTLHAPASWYPPEIVGLSRPSTYLHCVSSSQRAAFPTGAVLLDDIPNGVHLDDFSARQGKCRYALALGRIAPEKGFHLALLAARRAGVPMLLAGRVFPYEEHERYFAERIAPALDIERFFIGPLGLCEKRRWLARARCLLVPSLVPETSSLVAMEALASGTPVIAFRTGALEQIVEHGRTGYLVASVEEMAEAIALAPGLRPDDCRRAAEQRVSAATMCARYIALYERLARSPSDLRPLTRPEVRAEATA